jgi:hypothetical protein
MVAVVPGDFPNEDIWNKYVTVGRSGRGTVEVKQLEAPRGVTALTVGLNLYCQKLTGWRHVQLGPFVIRSRGRAQRNEPVRQRGPSSSTRRTALYTTASNKTLALSSPLPVTLFGQHP